MRDQVWEGEVPKRVALSRHRSRSVDVKGAVQRMWNAGELRRFRAVCSCGWSTADTLREDFAQDRLVEHLRSHEVSGETA